MIQDFDTMYKKWLEQIEEALPKLMPSADKAMGGKVVEAARYSLLAGGKRIRPVLALAVADMLAVSQRKAMPYACAVEMIHTYSLIHDDLPCMDDDDWRRGRKTCHIVYGEALAVLAGDALLNRAYEVLIEAIDPALEVSREAALYIARAAGSQGMIGGQTLDLDAEHKRIDASALKNLHMLKTGALLKAPIISSALLADADQAIMSALEAYADAIGLAFQIQDDILDVTSDRQQMGKSTGKDERDEKSTYVTLFGLEGAKNHLRTTIEEAHESLRRLNRQAGLDIDFLTGLTNFLLSRKN